MVSKEKMASTLDFDPGNSSYWSERHRDIVFDANYNAFATQCMMTQKRSSACNIHSLRSAMCSEKKKRKPTQAVKATPHIN
jgi:hypothetical protein